MRRAVPAFIVEVRRRPKLPTTSSPNVQSSETKPSRAAFDRESHRAAAAAFEAKNVEQPLVDVAASYPKGRILPSLVADKPLGRLLRDASLSAAESGPTSMPLKRPSVRPLKGRAQTSNPPRTGCSSAESMPLGDRLSATSRQRSGARSEEGMGVSASVPTTAPSEVVENSGGPALRAKAKRRDEMPISLDDGGATPLPNAQRSTITDLPAMPPSSVDERSGQSRKRTMMGRHTFGDELKRGERWKRRLLYPLRRRHAD